MMFDHVLESLEDQIRWHERKSSSCRSWYRRLKLLEIASAVLIPFAAGIHAPTWLIGCLGALIVILEGIQHINQYQVNWIAYRSTCEFLKYEKYSFLAKVGPYSTAGDITKMLAERVEALVSQEHARWVSTSKEGDSIRIGL